jgi:hypothetical protein
VGYFCKTNLLGMNLQHRIDLLIRLGNYILSDEPAWISAKEKAATENAWFIPEFIDLAANHINHSYLQKDILEKWAEENSITSETTLTFEPKEIGIVMAGNIPMVGFHDLLSVFISGHKALVKTSSKDHILIPHLVQQLISWEPKVEKYIQFAERLKNCDAYIATGSNNSSRYFEYYFAKYPHVIRRNRTSAAILKGEETIPELEKLSDDVYQYFGLGCRNVTKLFVPRDYDFVPILGAFKKYDHLADHNKYRNNYDYNLAVYMLNKTYYMTNNSILLIENASLFSPISQVNYEYYDDARAVENSLRGNPDLQCLVGNGHMPFGTAQRPAIDDHADGVNTLKFLAGL